MFFNIKFDDIAVQTIAQLNVNVCFLYRLCYDIIAYFCNIELEFVQQRGNFVSSASSASKPNDET